MSVSALWEAIKKNHVEDVKRLLDAGLLNGLAQVAVLLGRFSDDGRQENRIGPMGDPAHVKNREGGRRRGGSGPRRHRHTPGAQQRHSHRRGPCPTFEIRAWRDFCRLLKL